MAGPNVLSDQRIADNKEDEQILKGIQPKHQLCFKFFKICRFLSIMAAVIAAILFGLTFVETLSFITAHSWYRYGVLAIVCLAIFIALIAVIDRMLFLRKAPFDDWVFEISEKRLGTSIIFYDSKYIYINYDRGGKEVDKRDFVTEMSDKSVHYSYFYLKTDIDEGYIVVECKKRQPIPSKASFTAEDDKFWNIVPLGKTINPKTQSIAPIGWYLNDQNKNEDMYETIPSTSILIAGGTGCFEKHTVIPVEDTLIYE